MNELIPTVSEEDEQKQGDAAKAKTTDVPKVNPETPEADRRVV
jgi:hypothetical protein